MKIARTLATTFLIALLFVGVNQPSFAQDQEAKRKLYEQQTHEYLGIRAVGKLMSTKWKVEVDFGQAFEWSIKNKDLIRDSNGKTISFNSPVDALNFMNAKGWTLVTASGDDQSFYAVMARPRL